MIELNFCNGEVLVFNVEDWSSLRKNHRILGQLIGNLNTVQTLPLVLFPEEVLLLLDKQIAKVVDKNCDFKSVDKFENELFQQQKIVYKNLRKRQLEVMIDDIVAAKRQRGDERTKEEIFNEELEKSTQISKDNIIWPIFLTLESTETTEVSRDEILKKTSELKYRIYRDLWEKGYYITTGHKFGGDFLVYLGDPIAYHAIFIVHCVDNPEGAINSTEIVSFGRLATSVKKRVVLATIKNDTVSFITINWIDN